MFQIGETYIVVTRKLEFVVLEEQSRTCLKIGDELLYVGMRRVVAGMPHTDTFRFNGKIGFVEPNDNGHAFIHHFAKRKKRHLPEFEPYDAEKHIGKQQRMERSYDESYDEKPPILPD